MPKFRNAKIISKLYDFSFNSQYALGLTLSIYEIWKYIWAISDESETSEEKAIWIIYGINFIASIAATFYMEQERDNIETHNLYSSLTKKNIAIMVATALVPASIVAAGAAEFVDTVIPRTLLPTGSQKRASALILAAALTGISSMPGQMWSYANNLMNKDTFSFTILGEVFAHPKCTIKMKFGYLGLLFTQVISNILDNIPEVLSFQMLPLSADLKIILGTSIALGFSSLDLNNEISAVFGDILDNLNSTYNDTSASSTINSQIYEQLTISPSKKPGWLASTVINFVAGLNAGAYLVSAPAILTIFDKPYIRETHGEYYYLINILKLLPFLIPGSFSAYGQFKMVKPATEKALGYAKNRYSFHASSIDQEIRTPNETIPLLAGKSPTNNSNALTLV